MQFKKNDEGIDEIFMEYCNSPVKNQSELLIKLRQMADVYGGLQRVAETAHLNPTQIYRTLSEEGNPTLSNFLAIVKALGLRFLIRRRPMLTPPAEWFCTNGRRFLTDDGQPIKEAKSSELELMQADVAALIYRYCPLMHDNEIDQIIAILFRCKVRSPLEEIFEEFIRWISMYKRGTADFANEALLKPGGPSFFI